MPRLRSRRCFVFLAAAALFPLALAACTVEWQADPEPIDDQAWPVHTVCGKGSVVGIDVSTYQGTVDWAKVKAAGKTFAFARVTHGTGTIDNQFAKNWPAMKAAGIIRGAYQYFEPADDALEQAKLFVDKINAAGGFEEGDLPGVIDVEKMGTASAAQLRTMVHTWIDYVEEKTNRRPIIYAGSYFWDDHSLGTDFSSYPLWGPHYTTADCHLISSAWNDWTFWQHSDEGTVSGISGAVDLDRYNGDLASLKAFIADSIIVPPSGPEPGPEPKPEPGPEPAPEPQPEAGADDASAEVSTRRPTLPRSIRAMRRSGLPTQHLRRGELASGVRRARTTVGVPVEWGGAHQRPAVSRG